MAELRECDTAHLGAKNKTRRRLFKIIQLGLWKKPEKGASAQVESNSNSPGRRVLTQGKGNDRRASSVTSHGNTTLTGL